MPEDNHPEEAPLLNNTERQAAIRFQEEHGEWNVSFHGQTMRWSLNAAVSEANIQDLLIAYATYWPNRTSHLHHGVRTTADGGLVQCGQEPYQVYAHFPKLIVQSGA